MKSASQLTFTEVFNVIDMSEQIDSHFMILQFHTIFGIYNFL